MRVSIENAIDANNSTVHSTSTHDTGTVNNIVAQPVGKRKQRRTAVRPYNKSEIMKHAWRLFRAAKEGTIQWADALRKAWRCAWEAIHLSFDVESMSANTIPYREKTEDEKFLGYVYGRTAYYKKHGVL